MTRLRYFVLSALMLSFAAPAFAQQAPRGADQIAQAAASGTNPKQDTEETYKMLKLFGEVFERVRAQYVDPKTDKELIEFGKKQADELKKAADKANKAEALAQAQREREAEALAVQKKIRDLLDANLKMDGGGNGGGPE